MPKKKVLFSILLFSFFISLSSQICQPNSKNCLKCHPLTNLCAICEKKVYKPDQEGGCKPSHQCVAGKNYCIKCNDNDNICLECELGFFADENGGCSNTDSCVISEKGKCLECMNNFYLIKGSYSNFCKYKLSDDFKNCAEINFYTGKCISCEKNFYMNSDDKKCSNTISCKESTFGICTECDEGYFLDKTDDLCKNSGSEFYGCKISLDGKICNECNDGFFLSENNFCSKSQNCTKRNNINNFCLECSEGYFLSKIGNICTTEEHCQSANPVFGFCEICEDSFYIENETKKCFSNQENEKFKFCSVVSSGNCTKCETGYIFGKDNKCILSLNCSESKNGVCVKCDEGYHLGLDNKCINIEKCIYSNKGECIECEDNYYFEPNEKKCFPAINQYKNCKISFSIKKNCKKCKDDFYLSIPDEICYSNSEEGLFYKCAVSTEDGTECSDCIDNYFQGIKDLKCSKIERCAISENENKCIECDDYLCLDVKRQICVENYFDPENEKEKIYFNCNKTNEEGTKCEICNNDTELVNGFCVNKNECAEEKDGECVKCNDKSYGYDMCLNSLYGCVRTFAANCLRCDSIFNFEECTECWEGYELNDNGYCVEKIGS